MATRGHVRDLPAKAGSVKPEDGFAMVYETGRGAARTPGAMAKALSRADALVLATDPDREGEAIAWQVLSGLRKQDAVGDRAVHQVAFHEVTPAGVRTALARPWRGPGTSTWTWSRPGRCAARSTTWWATASRRFSGASCRAAGLPVGGAGAVGGASPHLRGRGGD